MTVGAHEIKLLYVRVLQRAVGHIEGELVNDGFWEDVAELLGTTVDGLTEEQYAVASEIVEGLVRRIRRGTPRVGHFGGQVS